MSADLTWIDFTRRSDPAQPYYQRRLVDQLQKHGYPQVLCFWTKAPAEVARLYGDLSAQLREHGTLVLAQVTHNPGYYQLEPGVTDRRRDLSSLVELLGPAAVRLRFDPIIPGFTTPGMFQAAVDAARCFGIRRITVNFLAEYPGVAERLGRLGIKLRVMNRADKIETLRRLGAMAGDIEVAGCAELNAAGLVDAVPGLLKSGCADAEWATGLRPDLAGRFKLHASRPGCLCVYSGDWGQYRNWGGPSCPHQCVYCYAGGGIVTQTEGAE